MMNYTQVAKSGTNNDQKEHINILMSEIDISRTTKMMERSFRNKKAVKDYVPSV